MSAPLRLPRTVRLPRRRRLPTHGPRMQTLETPWWFVERLEGELGQRFDLDVACESGTAKAGLFYTKEHDGLDRKNPWFGYVWLNPPYNNIGPWMARALEEARKGTATTFLLLPSRTGTPWYREYLLAHRREGICDAAVLEYRIHFVGGGSSPFEDSQLIACGAGARRNRRLRAVLDNMEIARA